MRLKVRSVPATTQFPPLVLGIVELRRAMGVKRDNRERDVLTYEGPDAALLDLAGLLGRIGFVCEVVP